MLVVCLVVVVYGKWTETTPSVSRLPYISPAIAWSVTYSIPRLTSPNVILDRFASEESAAMTNDTRFTSKCDGDTLVTAGSGAGPPSLGLRYSRSYSSLVATQFAIQVAAALHNPLTYNPSIPSALPSTTQK